MRAGLFPRTLFGRSRPSLPIRCAQPILRAVLRDPQRIRCGDLFIHHPQPILALCRALRDSGAPDCAVQVHWLDRSPAGFVQSFLSVASSTERPTR